MKRKSEERLALAVVGTVAAAALMILGAMIVRAGAADLPVPKKTEQQAKPPVAKPPKQSDRPAGMP